MTPELPNYGQMLVDDFFFSLNLDNIFSVVPATEPEPKLELFVEEAKLEIAKTMLAIMR